MLIRPLTAPDAARYQPLRLRALQEHPEAFASAFEEEQQLLLETVAKRLQQSSAERYTLGAFEEEELKWSLTLSSVGRAEDPTSREHWRDVCAARISWTRHWQEAAVRSPRTSPDFEGPRRRHPGGNGRKRTNAHPVSGSGVQDGDERATVSQDWGGVF